MTAEATHHPYRDRSTRLFVVGIFLIVLGCCSALLGAFSALTLLLLPDSPGAPAYGTAQVILSFAVYVGLGAALIALGVGSIRARRWVRPLVLILGWSWLAMGVMGGLMTAFMMPRMLDAFAAEVPALPWVMVGCLGTMFGLFGVLVPVVLILLYRGRDVAATLDARDPREVWTDKVPTPLLGLVLWLAYGAIAMAASSLYAVFPLGRTILTGAPAVVVYLALAALWAYLAVGLARRSRTAWWAAVAAVVGLATWGATVLPRTDWNELLRLMGTPMDQPGMPDVAALYQTPWFLAWMGLLWAGMLGYLLFVRRYLR